MTKKEDQQFVLSAQQGDRQAFDLLVKRYQHQVEAIARRYIYDVADAKDITQEAFFRAYLAMPSFRNERSFYTWLYRIAVNTAKNYSARSSKDRRFLLYSEREEDLPLKAIWLKTSDIPEKNVLNQEIKEALAKTLGNLSEEIRMAYLLREKDGLSYEDIATIMMCPIGTVRSRIFRAREMIETGIQSALKNKPK